MKEYMNNPRSFHRNYRHCNNKFGTPERGGDGCDPPQGSFSLIDVLSAIIGRIYRFLFYHIIGKVEILLELR